MTYTCLGNLTPLVQHLLTFGEKVTSIWSTNLHCANAQSLAEAKRQWECPEEWIAKLVRLKRMLVPIIKVICNMDHVYGFTCYLCVELKLEMNTRSLLNQALNPAHTSLLSFRCWPWGVYYSVHDWRAATLVQCASLIWPEWGLWPEPMLTHHQWHFVTFNWE